MDLNKAMIIGRLTKEPDARTTPQGQNVSSFSIATNFVWTDSSGKKQEKVEYHNIVAWRKLAEICNQYLKKGTKIYLEGRMQTRSWQDQSGVTKYRTEIVADNMIMLDRAGVGSSPQAPTTTEAPNSPNTPFEQIEHQTNSVQEPVTNAPIQEEEIRIEDIPF